MTIDITPVDRGPLHDFRRADTGKRRETLRAAAGTADVAFGDRIVAPRQLKEGVMEIQTVPVAKTGMLIRKPVSQVFEAFVNPEITTMFWFTKGSGRLQAGEHIRWDWEMYNISIQVTVKAIEEDKRILIEWEGYGGPTTVEWVLTSRPDNTTFVSITNSGFSGDGDEVVKQALDSTGGFALVLAGAKAFLEHNISLNLIADRFPDGH
jgi:uncharacterized protein YndB with AHSA1/START domain